MIGLRQSDTTRIGTEITHHDGQKGWVPSNPQVEDLKGKVGFGENYAMVCEPISFVNNLSKSMRKYIGEQEK